MAASEKWGDLATRLMSGVVMIAVGVVSIWAGGHLFHGLVALICGAMVWELVRILQPDTPPVALQLGGLSGGVLFVVSYLPFGIALPLLIAVAFVGISRLSRSRTTFATFTAAILVAGFGMILQRDDFDIPWMVFLVAIVVVTDVGGYFAGRLIGGPKFWPKVSPKKTWSGTAAGWIGAALVGLYYAGQYGGGVNTVGIAVALSMASQLGDVAESALKRRAGVKDSSALIPGHGGLLDRFDGMLGASLMLLLVEALADFPPVTP